MKEKKQVIYRYLSSILFTSFFLVFSTFFIYLPKQENYIGAFSYLTHLGSVNLISISEDLMLDMPYPVSDDEGMESKPYVFQLENTKNKTVNVQVIFQTGDGEEFVQEDAVKYVVEEMGTEIKQLDNSGIILTDTLNANESKTYHLKFWLQEEKLDDILGKYFQGTIEVKVVF